MLLCPVRGCHRPLALDSRQWRCEQGHSFDVARSGYTNLLQPQERRSKQPGDSAEVVAARRRLHDLGATRPLFEAIRQLVVVEPQDQVLDAGCGDGFYLGTLAAENGCGGHGIDISIPAVDAAARRYPQCEWIVGNADRFLPYADASFSLVLSITARMNPPEFERVLQPGGRLLVAVSAPDDLIELRGASRDRVPRTIGDFAKLFRLREQRRATTRALLSSAAVGDVRVSTYRPDFGEAREEASSGRDITFSLDLLLFDRLSQPSR